MRGMTHKLSFVGGSTWGVGGRGVSVKCNVRNRTDGLCFFACGDKGSPFHWCLVGTKGHPLGTFCVGGEGIRGGKRRNPMKLLCGCRKAGELPWVTSKEHEKLGNVKGKIFRGLRGGDISWGSSLIEAFQIVGKSKNGFRYLTLLE